MNKFLDTYNHPKLNQQDINQDISWYLQHEMKLKYQ
jgi:hypothetical protein